MKEKLKRLKPKHYIFILLGVLVIAVLIQLFLYYHVPTNVYFDEETQEVVFSHGFLYTLDGYTINSRSTFPADELCFLPLSDPSAPEYRFRPVPGDWAEEEIWINYRNSLTGERLTLWINADRYQRGSFHIHSGWFALTLWQKDDSFALGSCFDRRYPRGIVKPPG